MTMEAGSTAIQTTRIRGYPERVRVVVLVLVLVGCNTDRRSASSETPQVLPTLPPEAKHAKPQCDDFGKPVCVGSDVVECRENGSYGATLEKCPHGCKQGKCAETCAAQGVELVYVVDSASKLWSFDPRKLPRDPFRLVGDLACDPMSSPFSMAVDRRGIAWVLYANGRLYRVSIADASCSRVQLELGPGATRTFGMGYVTDGPKSENERLFVAANESSRQLAMLDTAKDPVKWVAVGPITADQVRSPELTGTSEGRLFAYFPDEPRSFVQELEQGTGKALGARLYLPPIEGGVGSYAFAHWGGTFYVFTGSFGRASVHAVDGKTGKAHVAMTDIAQHVVGAGVSTCAPLLESVP